MAAAPTEYAQPATQFVAERAATAAVKPAAAPISTAAAMPKVTSYQLPEADMANVATSAGLQWVGSNPEKIAAVQAQIAAEAKPVHVPRPRPAAVVLDAEPLVLVETKRDLREVVLPFEKG